jgi:RNA-directed DNA polymerase
MIKNINSFIRGYAESVRYINANKAFRVLDNYIFGRLEYYIRRTHPRKSPSWQRKHYFKKLNVLNRRSNWTFFAPGKELYVLQFAWFGVKAGSYVKIENDKCPDNPSHKYYFKARLANGSKDNFSWMRPLYNEVAVSQEGECPICGQDLSLEEFEVHHIKPRKLGGPDTFNNLVILHTTCHDKLHYGGEWDSLTRMLMAFKSTHKQRSQPN